MMKMEKRRCINKKRLLAGLFFALAGLFLMPVHGVEASNPTVDVTSISESSGVLTLNITANESETGLDSFGLNVTYASDRLQYVDTGPVSGLACSASVQNAIYKLGCYATGSAQKRVTIPAYFKIQAAGPYMFGVDKNSLTDDLKGAQVSRPGFFAGNYDFHAPLLWSVPSVNANLFWVIPDVKKVTDIALQYMGIDILFPILDVSSWYYDEIQDVAWLVMPALELPAGVYPVVSMVSYTDRPESYISVDVTDLN